MEGEKANAVTSLDRLAAAFFDYCTPSLPEQVPVFSRLHFSVLRPQAYSRKLTATLSPADHRLMASRHRPGGEVLSGPSRKPESWQYRSDASLKVEERCKGLN